MNWSSSSHGSRRTGSTALTFTTPLAVGATFELAGSSFTAFQGTITDFVVYLTQFSGA
jgi:hypothetical protein